MDSHSEHSISTDQKGSDDAIIVDLIRFQSGDGAAFWSLLSDNRVQKLIRSNVVKSTIRYGLNSNEIDDLNQQIILNIRERVASFKVNDSFDNEHRLKSFFEFLKLVLLGERDRAVKHSRGQVSKNGESRYSSLRTKIESYDFCETFGDETETLKIKEKDSNLKSKVFAYDFRKAIIDKGVVAKNEDFFRALVKLIENDTGVADFFNRKDSEKFERSSFTKKITYYTYLMRKIFAEETDMPIRIKILSIYTDHITISINIFENGNSILKWNLDYFSDRDLDTVEGKIGDLIRQHDFTFIVVNNVVRENKANALVERYLNKRSLPYEKIDLEEVILNLVRFDSLISIQGSIGSAKSWVLGMVKDSQIKIARTTV